MRRTILILGLFLVLGLSTTITIAWICAFVPYDESDNTSHIPRDWYRTIHINQNMWIDRMYVSTPWRKGLTPDDDEWDAPYWSDALDATITENTRWWEVATGWPLRSMRLTMTNTNGHRTLPADFETTGALPGVIPWDSDARSMGVVRLLPRQPIILGAVGDTMLFGALWCLAFSTYAFSMRGRAAWRRRKGRCARCNYSTRGASSDQCPECGTPHDWRPQCWTNRRLKRLAMTAGGFAIILAGWAIVFYASRPASPLHQAALDGDVDRIRALLDQGVPVDTTVAHTIIGYVPFTIRPHPYTTRNVTPLMWAAAKNHPDAVLLLLEHGADPHAYSDKATPLMYACARGHCDMIRLLAEQGADPHASSNNLYGSVWTRAVASGEICVLDALLEAGADMSRATEAIEFVSEYKNHEFLPALLQRGAPITHQVMANALSIPSPDDFDLIVQHGGNMNSQASWGDTLLFNIVDGPGMRPVWERIVDAGVDVNAKNQSGETALSTVMVDINMDAIQFLLDHGADPTVVEDNLYKYGMRGEHDLQWRDMHIFFMHKIKHWRAGSNAGDPSAPSDASSAP